MHLGTHRNIALKAMYLLPMILGGCATGRPITPSDISYASYEYPVEMDLSVLGSEPVPMVSGEEVVIVEGPARIEGAQQTVIDVTIEKNGALFATLPAGTLLTKVHIHRTSEPYPGIVAAAIVAQMEKNGQTPKLPETDIYCGVVLDSDKYSTACFVDRNRDQLIDTILVGDTGGGDSLSSAVLPIGTIEGVSADFTPFAIRPADKGTYTEARMRIVATWNGKKSVQCALEYYPMQNRYAHALPFDQAKAVFKSLEFDTSRVRLSESEPNLAMFMIGAVVQFKQDAAANTVSAKLISMKETIGGTIHTQYAR